MFNKSKVLFLFLTLIVPSLSFAQGFCDEDLQTELDFCIEDATDACLADYPECDGGTGGSASVADAVFQNIADNCCNKSSKTKRLLCFTGAQLALKRAGKALFARDISVSVKADLKQAMNDVKATGECAGEEDEEEDDDFTDPGDGDDGDPGDEF